MAQMPLTSLDPWILQALQAEGDGVREKEMKRTRMRWGVISAWKMLVKTMALTTISEIGELH